VPVGNLIGKDNQGFLVIMNNFNGERMGMAASMGAVLLLAGTKGSRFALPNSHVMIHQVSGGAQGPASDVERTVEFMYGLKKSINGIIAKHTGKTVKEVADDADRDYYMSAKEACQYGIVDKVMENRDDMPGSDGEKKK